MRQLIRQSALKTGLTFNESFVVSARMKYARRFSGRNRDGPLIFHMRDGPPIVTGPPGGTGPPLDIKGGSGPPKTTGPPMEWLVRKKNLKKE